MTFAILPTDPHPTDDSWKNSKRQLEQRVYFGTCRGRTPLVPLPTPLQYILNVLHYLLRTVPKIFLHTVQAYVIKETMK
jgi:hypothetical protein